MAIEIAAFLRAFINDGAHNCKRVQGRTPKRSPGGCEGQSANVVDGTELWLDTV